jgi:class 3 adenylate cyclase/tetratricopeptide (TPR) repeat protein
VNCSSCGTENEAGAKFCVQCAERLALACPACGTSNITSARFCRECAAPLSAGGAAPSSPSTLALPSAPPPVAERRLVSILFADLVGFTTLAEGRDAEDTRELLSRYFDLSREIISRYGGTVEKFIGDAVMAVWGAPTAHEDDAERAVRAALDLVDAVKGLGPGIAARAGVLTGEAAVTIGATNQGMVAGDLVNTASRLQSVAQSGTVLVGEATQRAASKAIAFEEAGEQTLKGKTSPVPAWRALRVVAEVGGRNRAETLEAPFVGRDDELRQLKDLFHATSRDRRARLVSVIGPAGIGKTRLAWELLKYLDGLVDTVWFHDGRSPAYGEGISFWALGEMVRERCQLLETDDESTTRAKISKALSVHVPDEDDRRWIEPALLALLGFESGVGSEQLFAAWRTFFERLAATAPVVLVFEDFHFADPGLLDFVDHLLELSRNVPIYVVTLSRPELLEKRPDWGAGKRNFTSLYLEPLAEPAMRELLAGLVPGLPVSAVKAIVARADGVPLYAVETVRMLLAEGKLSLDGDRYVPVGDLGTLAVPETLTALIASRLDSLDPADRALVSDAAVLGQSFTPAALTAVSGVAVTDLEPRLRSLVRREILSLEADPRSPERGQYAFVQALIREVAYNTLAHGDRKVRHLAAARFFESVGSDELAGALAGHYLAARANAPEGPERDALAGQARIALRAAALRAAALGAHIQAVSFLEQARSVTDEPGEIAGILRQAGEWSIEAGRFEAAESLLRRAIEIYRSIGEAPAEAHATAALANALILAFRTPEALALLEVATDRFANLGSDPALLELRHQFGRAYFLTEDSRRAIEVIDTVLEPAERANLVELVADALVTRGSALTDLGRDYEGMGVIEAGLRLAQSHGLQRVVMRARNNIGAFRIVRDPAGAMEIYRSAIAEATRLGIRGGSHRLFFGASDAGVATGEWDWCLTEMEAILATEPDREDRAAAVAKIVEILALRGEDVSIRMNEFESLVGGSTDPLIASAAHWANGVIAWAAGRLAPARTEFRAAARLSAQYAPLFCATAARLGLWLGDAAGALSDLEALDATAAKGPAVDLRRQGLQAGIAALEGRAVEAIGGYREALAQARIHGVPWDEALSGLEMATLLDPADPEVLAAANSAREIFVRLGAKPFLDRLDAALERQRSESAPEPERLRDASSV